MFNPYITEVNIIGEDCHVEIALFHFKIYEIIRLGEGHFRRMFVR